MAPPTPPNGDPPVREVDELHRVVLNSISDAVFITDDAGRFTFICPNADVIFGYSEDEVAELGVIDALVGSGLYQPDQLHREGEISNVERCIVDKHGQEHVILVNIKRVMIANGTVLITCRDITRRKEDELMLLQYQKELRSLASALTLAEERERRRIATALHDAIGQTLIALKMRLGAARDAAAPEDSAARIREAMDLLDRTIQHSRHLTFELSPPILHQLGLVPALEWLVDEQNKTADVLVELDAPDGAPDMPEELNVLLFRAARELIFNIHKHAHASHAQLNLHHDGKHVVLEAIDDGRGFTHDSNADQRPTNHGFGLFSIRERVRHLGGQLTIDSAPGEGTRATIRLPLDNHAGPDANTR